MKHREFTQSRTVQNSNTKTHSARDRTPSPSASQCAKMRASRASSCAASDRKPSIASPPLSSGRACRPRGTHSSTPRAIREFGLHSLRRRSLADDAGPVPRPAAWPQINFGVSLESPDPLSRATCSRSVGCSLAASTEGSVLLASECCGLPRVGHARGSEDRGYRSPSGRYAWGRLTQSPAGVQVVAATGCVAGVVWPPDSGVSR